MYQHQGLKVRKNQAKPSPPSERGLLNELKIGVRLFYHFALLISVHEVVLQVSDHT